MGPPFYDSLRPGSIISIRCREKEQLDEVTQEDPELETMWDEELSITSSRDVEDITYEDLVEKYMIIPSPYEANDEEWINPFFAIIEDGTTLEFADSCYMQMEH